MKNPVIEFIDISQRQKQIIIYDKLIRKLGFFFGSYLCYLIDFAKDKEEWFIFPIKYQSKCLQHKSTTIIAYRHKLESLNVLKIKWMNGFEYYQLNFEEINKILKYEED